MKYSKNFPHGIMFHHFHDNNMHKKTQGSIDTNQLNKIINYIGRKNILNPLEFIDFFKKDKLKKSHVCFTFDDSLRCQYDIALPLLEEKKIKAFFFIYSSIFDDKPDLLEIYRYFRTNIYDDLNKFYKDFFFLLNLKEINQYRKHQKTFKYLKKSFKFYCDNDIKFRIFRDFILNKKRYDQIMQNLFKEKKFLPKNYFNKIFISKKNLINLSLHNHEIGLHSHSHPTVINKFSFYKQRVEYQKNLKFLNNILEKIKIKSMSHPCGRYNNNTFKVLKKINIDIGFISLMKNDLKNKNYKYLIPRQDHSNIIKMMK